MNQKILSKVLATTLAVILTFANFIMLGVYAGKTYATSDTLENQKTVTNNENVEFDAYFLSENGNRTHTLKQDIDITDTKMYLSINVKKGYLKNGRIEITGEDKENANFRITNTDNVLETVESIDTEKNTITLKQLNSGTQIVLEIPITSLKDDSFDLSNFSKINNIKLTGTYVSDEGDTIEIEKTIRTRNEWTKEVKASIEQTVKSFIPYQVGENAGTILQTTLKTGLENNALPIKQTQVSINVPQVNGIKPEEVIVTANNTYATNNKSGEQFTENNWSYDKDSGILNITVNNEENENKVSWNKTNKDEYVITYIFAEKLQEVKMEQTAELTITAYNNVQTEVKNSNTLKIEQTEIIGNFVTTEISSKEELSKGYLYTKSEKEIEYNEKIDLTISYADLVDKISVQNNIDNFVNSNGQVSPTTISNINYAYYKTTSVNKENFEKILGTDGYIKILGTDGQQLAIFNKDTQVDENGNYVYTYEAETNQIKIETSKPIKEGKLEINNTKSLKGKTDYSKEQVASFEKLNLSTLTSVEGAGVKIQETQSSKDIKLIAPSTKIETSVSKPNLSTVVKNENVEFRVILKTNDITCDLYKNPVVEIVLPNYIAELNIKDVNLLFDNELKIKDYKTYINETGNIVIQVSIEGEDTVYNQDEVSKGANLVINTDISLKKLTPTTDGKVKVFVTNENVTTYETQEATNTREVPQKGYAEIALKAVAPVGMVTTNEIKGYNAKNETVTSISGEEQVGKLETRTDAKVATVTISVINNYNNVAKNISVLGRIPFSGNKDVLTGEELGSNLDATLASAITSNGIDASKVTIYYSTNGTATKDLTDTNNGWTTSIQDLTTVKSYLIVLNNYEMPTGSTLTFNYNINIPANLPHNESTYANYVVYFDNVAQDGTTSETAKASKVGLTTGAGPELEASIKANVENNADVKEGTRIKYTITVKNVGKADVQNVVVKGNIPEGAVYTEFVPGDDYSSDEYVENYDMKEYSKTIEILKAGETVDVEYSVKVEALPLEFEEDDEFDEFHPEDNQSQEDTYLEVYGTISADGLEKEIQTDRIRNKVVEGYLNVQMVSFPNTEEGLVKEGQTIRYTTVIENVSQKERTNIVVTTKIPEGTTFQEGYIATSDKITDGVSFDENSRTVTFNVGSLAGGRTARAILEVTVDKMASSEIEKIIKNNSQIKCSETDETFTTNEVSNRLSMAGLAVTVNSNKPDGKMTDEDTIEYYVTIRNIGKAIAKNVIVTDYIPDALTYQSTKYTVNGETSELKSGGENAANLTLDIEPGGTASLIITAKANTIEGTEPIEIDNQIAVSCENAGFVSLNSIKHTIEPTDKDVVLPDGSIEERKYNISGKAWLDSNKNGKIDETESTLGNIEIMLINADNGQIIKDENGNSRIVKTDENGTYTFEGITKGKYIVVFLYDAAQYDVTTYKAEGLNESENSDAITMKLDINGEIRNGAVSDAIELNENTYNINIGLVVNPKFDLKLDKVISKITVNDKNGSKVYEYNDSDFVKLDFNEKTINGTTIIVEYKIRVTNEGGVAGYAKKIVDYLPSGMEFSSELNQDWYTSGNGNVFNASLANTIINPGETKEITLLLTKKMTGENTGVVNNNAEIYESYNDLGLADMDSTPANKVQNEDDISSADAILGIKTGEVYVYIAITIVSIAILGVGIYLINKKVLRKI